MLVSHMEIPALFSFGSKLKGEVLLSSDIRIDGEVYGKVDSGKSVIIGDTGYVNGIVQAKDLVVFGKIEGNMIVSGTTLLHPGSSVFGNLYTKVFEVKVGAAITSRVNFYNKFPANIDTPILPAQEIVPVVLKTFKFF